ncbi:HK97 gp10 family phage protein [Lederbergia sp. NSJ-179]|uniref:HK97-gp10 family putative phage morphogenesis protein n=1 Tax=Lederbergia sp. NSJ-179 TaxID=2931402 RepID=UPI001FD2BD50|nr:HK97-gp10 family putative phage morphogenesis protein [Lederbergia sp. NSJ-179]MCJ7839979.1 HK97 gp10 family phage protein [Lederbergia sp. NSJ-179]
MAKDNFSFEDNSKEVKNQFHAVSEEAMLAALLLVEGQAKALAAVQTGEMRDKIDHKITSQGSKLMGQVGSPTEHAVYVEFGTGEFAENGAGRKGGWVYQDPSGEWFFTWGQEPQPFLRPAFRMTKKQVEQIFGINFKRRFGGK